MPLSREELEALQAESMADDVEIELDRMSRWTADEARAYFESGGSADREGVRGQARGLDDSHLRRCSVVRDRASVDCYLLTALQSGGAVTCVSACVVGVGGSRRQRSRCYLCDRL